MKFEDHFSFAAITQHLNIAYISDNHRDICQHSPKYLLADLVSQFV